MKAFEKALFFRPGAPGRRLGFLEEFVPSERYATSNDAQERSARMIAAGTLLVERSAILPESYGPIVNRFSVGVSLLRVGLPGGSSVHTISTMPG